MLHFDTNEFVTLSQENNVRVLMSLFYQAKYQLLSDKSIKVEEGIHPQNH